MEVDKPVFVIGSGRSGSTLFHHIMSNHRNVAWLSGLCNRYPARPSLNRFLMRAVDYPAVGPYLRRRLPPGECYDFWEHYCKGFRQPFRDLTPQDVTVRMRSGAKEVMATILTPKRSRLVAKVTGWPRVGFLREIFQDAKFIHVVRDGRAVVNSMLNVDFWWGWRGPQNWRWGELSPSQSREWEQHGKSFVALAAIQWKILMEAVETAKTFVNESDFMELKYETLCSDPTAALRPVIDFCELDWHRKFEKQVGTYKFRDANYKWKDELTDQQKAILEEVIHEPLERFGYL